jgi:tRNA(Ile)-lysidine synthase
VSCDGTRIAINRIVSEQRESLTILFELLRDFGFNVDQVAEMIHSYNTSGRRFYSKGYEALINRGLLLISHLSDGDSLKVNTVITDILNVTSWPIDCDVSIITPEDFAPNKGSVDVLFLDAEALLDDPIWMVRNWKNGDRIKPFGMKGSRKLSDIFSDAKLSVLEKQKVRVLTRNDEIIWIIGMRASRLFQVTSDTERILKIVLHNSEYLNT